MGMIMRVPLLALLAALFAATPEISRIPTRWAASEGSAPAEPGAQPSARALVEAAIDLTRGVASYAELSMTIHLPLIKLDEPNHWTELTYHDADFGIELDDSLFTVFSLESGREP